MRKGHSAIKSTDGTPIASTHRAGVEELILGSPVCRNTARNLTLNMASPPARRFRRRGEPERTTKKMKTKNAVSMLAAVLGLSAVGQAQSLTDGLVAYYPFNGNANDATGKGNHGTVIGANLTTDRFGVPSRAYSFNGTSSHVLLPRISEMDAASATTLSFWMKDVSDSHAEPHAMFGNLNSVDAALYLDDYYVNGVVVAILHTGTVTRPSVMPDLLGEWHQVVVAYDGTQSSDAARLRLYVDGNEQSLIYPYSIPSALPSGLASSVIGARWLGTEPGCYFPGLLDDFRIYDRALSGEEVGDLYRYEAVPEPATYAVLAGLGLFGFVAVRRLRRE